MTLPKALKITLLLIAVYFAVAVITAVYTLSRDKGTHREKTTLHKQY